MKWDAWGDPAAAKPLSDGIAALLRQALGISGDNVPAVGLADVRLRPSALSPADRTGLAAIVGDTHYADDDRSRLLRAGGKSTLNLLQRKDFEPQDAPDAVLAPGSDDEVAGIYQDILLTRASDDMVHQMGQDGGLVFLDPNAPPEHRFRMLCRFGAIGAPGLHILSSSNGIHWQLTHKSICTFRDEGKRHHLDSQNIMFWDDRLRKYVLYCRRNLFGEGAQGRSVARAESPELGGFPAVQDMPVMVGPDPGDRWVDYYSSSALKYPWAQDAYYMFPQAYFHYLGGAMPEFSKQTPINAGPLDTQFAASRDGVAWHRFDRRPFLRLGMKGEFDWASVRLIHGLVPDLSGREMYLYYRASDWLHGWDRNESNKRLLSEAGLGADQNIAVISRVVLRRDGFVSVHAPWTGGEFTTEPLRFKGSRLLLNADTSATGTIRVGLLDAGGTPIPGFSLDDCDLIHTCNEVNRVVRWKGSPEIGRWAGQPVRLRVVLKNADLYAFQFRD